MSVATAFARLRDLFTSTISRAHPRTMADIAHAAPTAPVPTIPIFIRTSLTDLDFFSVDDIAPIRV
jgi:hypothetical protein